MIGKSFTVNSNHCMRNYTQKNNREKIGYPDLYVYKVYVWCNLLQLSAF